MIGVFGDLNFECVMIGGVALACSGWLDGGLVECV